MTNKRDEFVKFVSGLPLYKRCTDGTTTEHNGQAIIFNADIYITGEKDMSHQGDIPNETLNEMSERCPQGCRVFIFDRKNPQRPSIVPPIEPENLENAEIIVSPGKVITKNKTLAELIRLNSKNVLLGFQLIENQ